MTKRPALSKAELQIARTLWDLGEASGRQVHSALPKGRSIEFPTVQTYLRRLEEKGYVSASLIGRTRVYKPRVRPRTVIRETVDEFVDQLFDGNALPLMRHLVEERGMTAEELDELRRLVDQWEQS